MIKPFVCQVLLFLFGLTCSVHAAASTEYYRHLVFRESPYEDIRGNYPIAKKEAEQSLHYRFVRNEQGKLIEVSRRIGDVVVPDNGSWEGFLWFSPVLRIDYEGTQEIRRFHGLNGSRIAAHGQVYEQRFSLDSDGKRQSVQFFDQQGKPIDSEWGIQRYEWQRHADGSVIENRYSAGNEPRNVRSDFPFGRIRMEFGTDDLLDFVYNLDEKGELKANETGAAVDRIIYDQHTNFVRWQVYDLQRRPINGNGPQVAVGEHLYDHNGNKVGLRGFDVDGRDREIFGGSIANEYDRFGNIVRTKVGDLNGNVLQDVHFFLTGDGLRRLRLEFRDGQGKLANNADGIAVVEYSYDESNSPTGRRLLDASGQAVGTP